MSYSFDDYQGHLDEMLRDAYQRGREDALQGRSELGTHYNNILKKIDFEKRCLYDVYKEDGMITTMNVDIAMNGIMKTVIKMMEEV